MAVNTSSVLMRRRFGAELERIREEAGLTIEQVAVHLGCHKSKVSRIELGRSAVRPGDLARLLDLYELGPEERRELESAVGDGRLRERSWWSVYHDVLNVWYAEFIALEDVAVRGLSYQPLALPGLLQTADYARALLDGGLSGYGPHHTESLLEVRMRRQQVLTRERPMELVALTTEAALRIEVGGPEVMRGQLRHLLEAAKAPNVELRIIPNSSGTPATYTSGITLFDFADGTDPSVAFLETLGGTMPKESERDVRRVGRVFEYLANAALSPEASADLLVEVARGT